jgi:AmmeMemoRadiSam system protein B
LIGPHAGYRYSGPTAAFAYVNITPEVAKRIKRVFLLGPSHKAYLEFIATTKCTEWETPLGNWKIDTDTVNRLCENEDLFQ